MGAVSGERTEAEKIVARAEAICAEAERQLDACLRRERYLTTCRERFAEDFNPTPANELFR